MGLKCCVDSCQIEANSWNIQLYSFPLNSPLYNKWVAAIKKYDQIEYCRNLRVCSRHFKLQDREKGLFGYSKLKLGAIPSVFVHGQRSIFKDVENIKNYRLSAEEIISKKTLELLVHHGVFTDEDLEARLEREKYWNTYLHGYYENEKRLSEHNFNYVNRLYEGCQSCILELFSIQLKLLKLK
ncbi:uncharacterized protein LOC132951022 [Metopolophium dirhodum]|uniref:uncharacterized protein LOC132951022 n=1 Tax=Metopolophium dirhodum TaxID=44670 RepID=UPI00298F5D26|nr:uncharacterized protein LOC132951022 [Metopolophium dirhodum]